VLSHPAEHDDRQVFREVDLGATNGWTQAKDATPAELIGALASFLAAPRPTKTALPLQGLDGYLTAIAIGPELVMPSEWMFGLWDDEEPAFADREQAQTILSAIMARYNEILHQLERSPPDFRPLYLTDNPGGQPSMALVAQWANGFWKGMGLRGEAWRTLINDRGARDLLAPIVYFVEDSTGRRVLEDTRGEDDELMQSAGDLIPAVVPAIREYWRRRSGAPAAPRTSRRPGRNEPCPCGSGRKYKRCCGAG
jgi:uncharacterized protein